MELNALSVKTVSLGVATAWVAIGLMATILLVPRQSVASDPRIKLALESAALEHNVPPKLLIAVCTVESSLRPHVTNFDDGGTPSHGLCQIKTATAKDMHCINSVKDLYNVETNARCCAAYLQFQYKRYRNWPDAIAAYNAGSVKRDKKGKLVNQKHVNKVLRIYKRLK